MTTKEESKSAEKSKETKEVVVEKEKEKERRRSTSSSVTDRSFPAMPSNTTDSVRLKCREMLCNAIKGDGAPVDGIFLTTYNNK